jgi:hypothetical protein
MKHHAADGRTAFDRAPVPRLLADLAGNRQVVNVEVGGCEASL